MKPCGSINFPKPNAANDPQRSLFLLQASERDERQASHGGRGDQEADGAHHGAARYVHRCMLVNAGGVPGPGPASWADDRLADARDLVHLCPPPPLLSDPSHPIPTTHPRHAGGGKGTIAKKMIKDFSFLHLSTGDVLRKHVREGTKVGKTAQSYMVKGAWVRVRGRRVWVLVGYCCGCSRPVGRSTMSFNCVSNANQIEPNQARSSPTR